MSSPRLVYAPAGEPPFPIDALVEEEDTYLSLSAETVLEMPGEHPVRVMTAAQEAEENEPGTIVVRSGDPVKLLAVVHRLHESPTWQESWIHRAIENLRNEVQRRRIRALGTPLLGTVHGEMDPDRSLAFLSPLLAEATGLQQIWIVRRCSWSR